jgi:hypothetical protein
MQEAPLRGARCISSYQQAAISYQLSAISYQQKAGCHWKLIADC